MKHAALLTRIQVAHDNLNNPQRAATYEDALEISRLLQIFKDMLLKDFVVNGDDPSWNPTGLPNLEEVERRMDEEDNDDPPIPSVEDVAMQLTRAIELAVAVLASVPGGKNSLYRLMYGGGPRSTELKHAPNFAEQEARAFTATGRAVSDEEIEIHRPRYPIEESNL